MTNARGLLPDEIPPPDKQLLLDWLAAHDVHVSDHVEINTSDLGGWGVKAKRDMDPDHLLLSVPKTSILSARTTSLVLPPDLAVTVPDPVDPMGSVKTNHTIPTLALVLLHEFRLGEEGEFWGYVQSLPREVEGLPIFWDRDSEARRWLRGTEAERELDKKDKEHMGLDDLKRFYETTKHILPPTPSHPGASPVEAYLHAYALVTTRAFLIDLYHTLAFVPFADILNHSSRPHTSLASDDFVCHLCGSLAQCPHDDAKDHVPLRLAHLDPRTRAKLELEPDTVEMRIETRVSTGEEVMNTYGEGISDERLLVEWGFTAGGYRGDGIVWELEEVLDNEELREVWEGVVDRRVVARAALSMSDHHRVRSLRDELDDKDEDDSWHLIAPPASTVSEPRMLNLNQDGQVSLNIWIAYCLPLLTAQQLALAPDDLDKILVEMYKQFDHATAGQCISDSDHAEQYVGRILERMADLLHRRLQDMYEPEPDIPLWELFDQRDELNDKHDRGLRMAMTLALDQRALIAAPLDHLRELRGQLS